MRLRRPAVWILLFSSAAGGCAGLPQREVAGDSGGAKTLLAWSAGRAPEPKPPADPDAPPVQEKEEPLTTDRPDFTEASSTVGRGRVQLEAGYTFTRDRSGDATSRSHSYPEALLRVGAVADWLEFRLGQNFGHAPVDSPNGVFGTGGAEDLYLGVKLGLTEQKQVLPEVALILQTTVPTGHRDFTSSKLQPGFNLLYGWDVIEDRLSFAGSSQANRALDATGHGYVELAQSLTAGYTLTERLGAYTEWFAFFPTGALAPGVGPQQYLDGGFTFRLTPNVQFDVRAGVGLNRQSDDYFAGTGFAIRY
ncbi:Uncharacterized protein OS=Blastopirellula marina DSM 3645 GN=DSM3645_16740 PE=4 SV=1: Phenol_MetA_deg [Gemmataceae bacterium]|nr:Uncharacterized protein OS=Blastopirellula marina DSM 3645 GN=DSM3645_16740 PE=4 SV=1: Phenol_MetA_deg [Gemmataceae bacterium]VTU01467.1 Uncharacterized protein OS=Blastopirellula marina DSM 3645 GN=DSM3645_16740 PE=4 SV=1: Phenol_MetA_deg [Gemmataceae bacterium]